MSASRIEAPFFADCAIALISAWIVRKQLSSVSPEGGGNVDEFLARRGAVLRIRLQ